VLDRVPAPILRHVPVVNGTKDGVARFQISLNAAATAFLGYSTQEYVDLMDACPLSYK
jgi:hypothetical protein